MWVSGGHDGEQHAYQDNKIAQDLPFSTQESHRAFGDIPAYFLHPVIAGILLPYPYKFDPRVDQSYHAHHRNQVNQVFHNLYFVLFFNP